MKFFEALVLSLNPAPLRSLAARAKLGIFACLTLALASPAGAETLRAHYSLSLIGFSIGSATASGVIERRNRYRVDIAMHTSGLANLVNNSKAAASASGALSHNGPAPVSYANTMSNSSEMRVIRMSMGGNSVRAVDVRPEPWDAALRIPVTESNKRNVLDPVSALIMNVPEGQALTGPAACNRNIPVFDGVTRFDVSLSYVDTKIVRTRGYAGPVSVCSARYRPISGHRPDSSSTRYMAENSGMDVWLAPLPQAHVLVPYHIGIQTSAGMLTIDAAEFQIGQRQALSTE
jgi:hypothetical protein